MVETLNEKLLNAEFIDCRSSGLREKQKNP
jgi:hypothetical protein